MREPLMSQMLDPDVGTAPGVDHPNALHSLAMCLFELRAAQEAELSSLTSMQRHLERIRCAQARHGEADLLLSEIARLLREAAAASELVAHHRSRAAELVARSRAEHIAPPLVGPRLVAVT